MGNENKSVLVVRQIPLEPFNVFSIKVVCRLVQQENFRIFQQKLCQKNLRTLTARKLVYFSVETYIAKPQTSCDLFNTGINSVIASRFQHILNLAHVLHELIHFLRGRTLHFVVCLKHFLLGLHHIIEGCAERVTDCHPGFQYSVLVKIAYLYTACPFYLACIRRKLPRDNCQKGRFSLSICTNKGNMLSAVQLKAHILEDFTPSVAV